MFTPIVQSNSNSDISVTNRAKSSQLVNELNLIFKSQAQRIMTISANFSQENISEGKVEEKMIATIPRSSFVNMPPIVLTQFFDVGRYNSLITNPAKHSISSFEDHYHRDAFLKQDTKDLSLSYLSCVIKSSPGFKVIPFVDFLQPLVNLYFARMATRYKVSFEVFQANIPLSNIGYTEKMLFIKTPEMLEKDVLHSLGMLGALPNRDRQLKLYAGNFDLKMRNVLDPRETQLKWLSILHKNESIFSKQNIKIKVDTSKSLVEQKKNILHILKKQQGNYSTDFETEQRFFYYQLLLKLMNALFISDDKSFDFQHRLQISLSLNRIQEILEACCEMTYASFLRTIESCIEEILLILSILNINQYLSVSEVGNAVKHFISAAVKKEPQMAVLRSSGMQAIWNSFWMAFSYFLQAKDKPSFNLLLSGNGYFEIETCLKDIFEFTGEQASGDICLRIRSNLTAGWMSSNDAIFDIYLANFESNVLPIKQNVFTDISSFIEKQLNMRTQNDHSQHPLFVILDHTLSDFDSLHLTSLLEKFIAEIEAGKLCILVSCSGNKYLHLGTDKVLATILCGYYNPKVLELIHQELSSNKIGDFNLPSPTILLTLAFLENAREEILSYSKLIRRRTLYLCQKTIPNELLTGSGCFTIDDPHIKLDPLQGNSGFLTLRYKLSCPYDEVIFTDLESVLNYLGIKGRDGFGFSQTTKIAVIYPEYPIKILRISVGTESLDSISHVIKLLCDYLIKINSIIQKYQNKEINDDSLLLHQIKLAFSQVKEEYEKLQEEKVDRVLLIHH